MWVQVMPVPEKEKKKKLLRGMSGTEKQILWVSAVYSFRKADECYLTLDNIPPAFLPTLFVKLNESPKGT